MAPHRALLAAASRAVRLNLWQRHCDALFAADWEDSCRQSVAHGQVDQASGSLHGPCLPGFRYWHGSGPEWDVVSQSADGTRLLLGEAEWSDRPVRLRELERMVRSFLDKGVPPVADPKHREVVRCLFVPALADPVDHMGEVHIVTAEHLCTRLR